jgi:undecaprenyl-diphosphatase
VNDYLLSVILGIVEGLTEFLPVSSTAHLRICERLFDMPLSSGYWKMYSVVIQLGAVLCLPVYFRARIMKMLRTFPRGELGDLNPVAHPLTLTLIAFAVTAGPAYLLSKIIGENLDNFFIIGSSLLLGGVVMAAVDWMCDEPKVDSMERMGLGRAIWIGAAQILSAVFPGTSRSMATIASGQVSGMSRSAALEFSFFLSIPTMFAATLFALKKAIKPPANAADPFSPGHMTAHQWIVLAIGFAVSFIVALGVVAWFMNWVRRRGFMPFAIYRIVLGIAILIWARNMHG